MVVGHMVWDWGKPCIRIWHADIFRLAAVDPAAEFPAALRTVVDKPFAAKPTVPAKGDAVGRNTLAHLALFYAFPNGDNLSDKLMPQHCSRYGPRDRSVQDVQVERVTFTIASPGSFNTGTGRYSKRRSPNP